MGCSSFLKAGVLFLFLLPLGGEGDGKRGLPVGLAVGAPGEKIGGGQGIHLRAAGVQPAGEAIARPDRLRIGAQIELLRVCGSEDESRRLRRRMAELKPMLTQCRKLSCLTARYYDRDFYGYDEYRL